MMIIHSILTYLILISFTFLLIYQAYLLKTKYPVKFLNNFYYYISLFYIYGFILFTTRIFFTQLASENSQFLKTIVTAIILPLIITSLYYLLIWTGELINIPVEKWVIIFFWILQTIVFILFFTVSLKIAESTQKNIFNSIISTINIFEILLTIYPFSLLILKAKNNKEKKIQKFSIFLGIQYIILFPGIMILNDIFDLPSLFFNEEINIYYFLIFTFYFINIPPIFYIKYFLKKNHYLFSQHYQNSEIEKNIFLRFDINSKEKEIIDLIIKGKINEEIGDLIYCSTKTVKNKITNIYKKFGVKNRVELVGFVLSESKNINHKKEYD